MDKIGLTLSNLIEQQFPEVYRETGPILVAFVEKYYEWLEQKSASKDEYFPFRVSVKNLGANVVGFRTSFTNQFVAGDQIAICKDEQTDDYDMYTVKTVANNTLITLSNTKLPNFTASKALYSTVSDKPNALFVTRNFFDIKDIDNTFDEYVIYFKEKYLKNLQFRTITDTKTLVKHSLDLYRSKGTNRSIDLLHKIVFGKPASVYYPKTDLFKLSSGEWYIPQYIELSLNPNNPTLVNKEVQGTLSGAIAFIEQIIRRNSGSKIIEIAYISAISGNFITGEKIMPVDKSLDINDVPTIVGSLNDIQVDVSGTGENFENNEIVEITSINGRGGKAKVASIASSVGQLSFALADGGYGYANTIQVSNTQGTVDVVTGNTTVTGTSTLFQTDYTNGDYISIWSNSSTYQTAQIISITSNTELAVNTAILFTNANTKSAYTRYFAQTFVSDSILTLDNVTFDPLYNNFEYFPFLGSVSQPLATLTYVNANNDFTVGSNVYTWHANNDPKGSAVILSVGKTTAVSGLLTVSVRSGTMNDNTVLTFGNTVAANISVFADITATANVIGNYSNVTVECTTTPTFTIGEDIIQVASGAEGTVSAINGNSVIIDFSTGIFKNGFNMVGETSGAESTVQSVTIDVGVINIVNDFKTLDGNLLTTSYMNTGIVTAKSQGFGAAATFSKELTNTEVITISSGPYIRDYLTLALNITWPFPAYPTANLNTIIADTFTTANLTIGKVEGLLSFSPGIQYNKIPIIRLFEPTIYSFDKPDTFCLWSSDTPGFTVGEIITQASSSARGLIKEIEGAYLIVENLRFNESNYFVPGTVVGADSGASANVATVDMNTQSARLGSDIALDTSLVVASGAINALKVIDSGFGFVDGEAVTLQSGDKLGSGFAVDETHGTGSGFYKTHNGFVSDVKKLSDGYYWQEYSYEVRSSIINSFRLVLKEVVHVAGTKYFDALIYDSLNGINKNVHTSILIASPSGNKLAWGANPADVLEWGSGYGLEW